MAIIRTTFMLDAIRGSADGVVFSDGLGGPYMKTKPGTMPPLTPRQLEIASTLTLVSQAFTALSDAIREAWKEWSKTHYYKNSLGEDITGNANAAFTQVNMNRLLLCAESAPAILEEPPTTVDVPHIVKQKENNIATTTRVATCNVNPILPAKPHYWYNCRLSHALPPGATSLEQPLRILTAPVALAAPEHNIYWTWIADEWPDELGAGERVVFAVQGCNYENGFTTPIFRLFADVGV